MASDTVDSFLDHAEERAQNDPVELTVRELLKHWDAMRRGSSVVRQINRDLRRHRLTTEPPFEEGWIDTTIALIPRKGRAVTPGISGGNSDAAPDDDAPEVSLRVGSLESATVGVRFVRPEQTLLEATSTMMRHDYSQLAVMSGSRTLNGAVSWESIGKARVRGENPTLAVATVPTSPVTIDTDLISQVPRIIEDGFVFVTNQQREISGIITTADLSDQFASVANPFFLIGEVERRLRRAVTRRFSADDLRGAQDSNDSGREVNSAEDMTMGELARLLEAEDRFVRLGWAVDRTVFVDALHEVRVIRNDVMHFSPDPLAPEQLQTLHCFIKWLRTLDPAP